jgi:hypothetical protein
MCHNQHWNTLQLKFLLEVEVQVEVEAGLLKLKRLEILALEVC